LNRLLIADEYEMQRNIKIYTTAGEFTGKVIPHKYFYYEPEGIALWACESDTSGYYITTDQDVLNNFFPVFDRKSLAYQGRFAGKITRNTDGVALSQHAFGPFEYGAFYPVHDDGSITAMDWTAIADSLNLRKSCQ
jgi:3-phytase